MTETDSTNINISLKQPYENTLKAAMIQGGIRNHKRNFDTMADNLNNESCNNFVQNSSNTSLAKIPKLSVISTTAFENINDDNKPKKNDINNGFSNISSNNMTSNTPSSCVSNVSMPDYVPHYPFFNTMMMMPPSMNNMAKDYFALETYRKFQNQYQEDLKNNHTFTKVSKTLEIPANLPKDKLSICEISTHSSMHIPTEETVIKNVEKNNDDIKRYFGSDDVKNSPNLFNVEKLAHIPPYGIHPPGIFMPMFGFPPSTFPIPSPFMNIRSRREDILPLTYQHIIPKSQSHIPDKVVINSISENNDGYRTKLLHKTVCSTTGQNRQSPPTSESITMQRIPPPRPSSRQPHLLNNMMPPPYFMAHQSSAANRYRGQNVVTEKSSAPNPSTFFDSQLFSGHSNSMINRNHAAFNNVNSNGKISGNGPILAPPPRRKNATRETTSALKAWLIDHRKNPYPTKGEKIMLAIITKMTLTQVSTWFANARRRLKKENPHHNAYSTDNKTSGNGSGIDETASLNFDDDVEDDDDFFEQTLESEHHGHNQEPTYDDKKKKHEMHEYKKVEAQKVHQTTESKSFEIDGVKRERNLMYDFNATNNGEYKSLPAMNSQNPHSLRENMKDANVAVCTASNTIKSNSITTKPENGGNSPSHDKTEPTEDNKKGNTNESQNSSQQVSYPTQNMPNLLVPPCNPNGSDDQYAGNPFLKLLGTYNAYMMSANGDPLMNQLNHRNFPFSQPTMSMKDDLQGYLKENLTSNVANCFGSQMVGPPQPFFSPAFGTNLPHPFYNPYNYLHSSHQQQQTPTAFLAAMSALNAYYGNINCMSVYNEFQKNVENIQPQISPDKVNIPSNVTNDHHQTNHNHSLVSSNDSTHENENIVKKITPPIISPHISPRLDNTSNINENGGESHNSSEKSYPSVHSLEVNLKPDNDHKQGDKRKAKSDYNPTTSLNKKHIGQRIFTILLKSPKKEVNNSENTLHPSNSDCLTNASNSLISSLSSSTNSDFLIIANSNKIESKLSNNKSISNGCHVQATSSPKIWSMAKLIDKN